MIVTVTGLKSKPNTEVFNLSLLLKSTEKNESKTSFLQTAQQMCLNNQ